MTALVEVLTRRMKTHGYINEYYEASFVELMQAGYKVMPVDLGDILCMEIDTPEDLDSAREVFKNP